jgi:hypothetical protein
MHLINPLMSSHLVLSLMVVLSLGGSDVHVMWETYCTADVTGIGAKSLTNLPICMVGAVIQTQKGPIIGVFNQYAH